MQSSFPAIVLRNKVDSIIELPVEDNAEKTKK
jgi:hypothetical protein